MLTSYYFSIAEATLSSYFPKEFLCTLMLALSFFKVVALLRAGFEKLKKIQT